MCTLEPGYILRGKSYAYEIERRLGQGSFGITYLAKIKLSGALGTLDSSIRVAVKEFFMREINGREGSTVTCSSRNGLYDHYRVKFAREAENLSRLQHPNIVRVLESFEANNTVYYAMEYIEGGSLDDYIAERGGLPEAEAVDCLRQIGSALSYMHAHKMLHLDLKPSNIMRNRKGAGILIDFGLSKQYDDAGQPESSTTIGGGTPGYAPLEQSDYREGRDFPVTMDVYALGSTLFKMLTGKQPPKASALLNEGFPAHELQERGVSDDVIACVAKAMAPMKAQRYQSVEAFVSALLPGAAQPEIVAMPRVATEETEIVAVPEPESSPEIVPQPEPAPVAVADHPVEDVASEDGKREQTKGGKSRTVRGVVFAAIILAIVLSLTFMLSGKVNVFEEGGPQTTVFENRIPDNFVKVAGGSLHKREIEDDEWVYRDYYIEDFYIDKYELTQREYERVMGTLESAHYTFDFYDYSVYKWKSLQVKGDSIPIFVSLRDLITYCNKRSADEGYDGFYTIADDKVMLNPQGNGYRLPIVHEWIWAAQGGVEKDGFKYPGSDKLGEIAWYGGNSHSQPHSVGQKLPNSLGLYDVIGNVQERMWGTETNSYSTSCSGMDFTLYIGSSPDDIYVAGDRDGARIVLIPKDYNNANIEKLKAKRSILLE